MGKAIPFYSSSRVKINSTPSMKIKQPGGEGFIGQTVDFTIVKNKVGSPFGVGQSNLYFGVGFNKIEELIEEGVTKEIFEKGGAWFTLPYCTEDGEVIKVQGKNGLKSYFEQHPEELEKIESLIREKIIIMYMPLMMKRLMKKDIKMGFYQSWMAASHLVNKIQRYVNNKNSHTEKVKNFMTIAGQTVNNKPTVPSTSDALLRVQLTLEETIEMAEAVLNEESKSNREVKTLLNGLRRNLEKMKSLSSALKDKDLKVDLLGVYDAIVDIDYVNTGAAITFGLDLESGFNEVHASNMSKFVDGKALKNENGKVIKGPNYWAPDLSKFIK